jgi:hypothetical protein
VVEAQRLKSPEEQNRRLKPVVAELTLDERVGGGAWGIGRTSRLPTVRERAF